MWHSLTKEMLDIDLGNVVGNHIVLGNSRKLFKAGLVVLVAFDPFPVDFDRKSTKFCSIVTKKIKVRLLGFPDSRKS